MIDRLLKAGAALVLLAVVSTACTVAQAETTPSQQAGNPAAQAAGNTTEQAANKANANKPNFLSTSGAKIVDSQGRQVTLTGINWFGMETGTYAPHGLWARNWEEMLDQIKDLGYNTIRLPYSNEIFDPTSKVAEGVDYKLNPDLEGLSSVEIMDKIVEGAGKRGLKIVLDRHRPDSKAQSDLWYTDKVSEQRWIDDWKQLAARYKGNDTVIGADLHNEPHGAATWGDDNPKTDWRLAAERAGNAIQEVNPDWLILVEGVDNFKKQDYYWWGGSLAGAAEYPVRLSVPNKLVYSAHDYGPGVSGQSWFKDASFPNNMPALWEKHWGYLITKDIAPVLIGEFGGKSVDQKDVEGVWQQSLLSYLKERGISYTYWSLNPNSGDTGGVLMNDWKSVDEAKQAMLTAYQAPSMSSANPSAIARGGTPSENAPVVPVALPTSTPAAQAKPVEPAAPAKPVEPVASEAKEGLKVLFRTALSASTTNMPAPELQLLNVGAKPVNLADLELRYWLADEDEKNQVLEIDWATVGKNNVRAEVVPAATGPGSFIRFTFSPNAGQVSPGGNVEIKSRLHKADWSDYDQAKHFSFKPTSSYVDWAKITLYQGGNLVWGVEPS